VLQIIAVALLVTPPAGGWERSDVLPTLAGEWKSPLLPSPGSRDALRQRTLEFGVGGRPDAVRLTWTDWCGKTSFGGGTDFVGRVGRVEEKEKSRVLVLADGKGTEYRVEVEATGNELKVVGKIGDVGLNDTWTLKPAGMKELRERKRPAG
jgi:hypothetical protein